MYVGDFEVADACGFFDWLQSIDFELAQQYVREFVDRLKYLSEAHDGDFAFGPHRFSFGAHELRAVARFAQPVDGQPLRLYLTELVIVALPAESGS